MKVNAEIIAVGSELLLGQIVNTNAQFISQKLAEIGVNVYYHTVVGDNASRLMQAIQVAQKRSNCLIFTGGLGPTKDDLTKETIASSMKKRLVLDQEAMANIQQYFAKTKRSMSDNNRKQALVIEGSTILPNHYGMAPGMALETDGIVYMLMPGVPKEMKPMFVQYGIPFLQKQFQLKEKILSRVLRFFGIGESQLETDLEDLIDGQTNPTIAPLAKDGEVTLRLTAKHENEEAAWKLIDDMEHEILKRIGEYFYGYGETSLHEQLMNLLKEKQLTIAAAESLTGGLFCEQLTQFPGASKIVRGGVVCYTNEIKQHVLGVKEETLKTAGAVSGDCAKQMAEKVKKLMNASIGISFTGVAGPEPSEGKSVGTVYIGVQFESDPAKVYELHLSGSRDGIRRRTSNYGCHYLMKLINKMENR